MHMQDGIARPLGNSRLVAGDCDFPHDWRNTSMGGACVREKWGARDGK
jgi:hypothetical protein